MTPRDRAFDAWVDDTSDPVHIPVLGRPVRSSDILVSLDKTLYSARREEWLDANLDTALGRDVLAEPQFKKNRERFDWLAQLVARRRVIPFVGAGSSASCGMPTWTNYLKKVAAEHRFSAETLDGYIDAGRYEEAASGLLKHITETAFREAFDRSFAVDPTPDAEALPTLIAVAFDGPVITTNFDRLLELVPGPPFQTFLGSSPGEFQRAAREGRRALLKLHGDLYQPTSRVLTKREYDKAYGRDNVPEMSRDLPRTLRWVFLRDTVLFIGASLSNDRTMMLIQALAQDKIEGPSMRHFAILEVPAGATAVRAREKFLMERSVFPIWYATGEHSRVRDLLRNLSRVAQDLR